MPTPPPLKSPVIDKSGIITPPWVGLLQDILKRLAALEAAVEELQEEP